MNLKSSLALIVGGAVLCTSPAEALSHKIFGGSSQPRPGDLIPYTAAPARPMALPVPTVPPLPSPPPLLPTPTPSSAPSPTLVPTPSPSPSPKPKPLPPGRTVLTAYHGLGTWVDGFDYTREYHGSTKPSSVDSMAKLGVRTIYIQAARDDSHFKGSLCDPDLLAQFLTKAHSHKMRVVAWYLPTLTNTSKDLTRIKAMLAFRASGQRFDSIGIDIESRAVHDSKTRSNRLVSLSRSIRTAAGSGVPVSAIVLPPVVTDVINKKYWPGFPWHSIASLYDVWAPMGYWTGRTQSSGYRDAYKYTHDNVALLRRDLGVSDAPVHVAGGLGSGTTPTDVSGMNRAAKELKVIGTSLYDYATTARSLWAYLRKGPS